MGCYMDKPHGTVTPEFLLENGAVEQEFPAFVHPDSGSITVCEVTNPAFKAMGVCYSDREFSRFVHEELRRPKRWFTVPLELVRKHTTNVDDWIKEAAGDAPPV